MPCTSKGTKQSIITNFKTFKGQEMKWDLGWLYSRSWDPKDLLPTFCIFSLFFGPKLLIRAKHWCPDINKCSNIDPKGCRLISQFDGILFPTLGQYKAIQFNIYYWEFNKIVGSLGWNESHSWNTIKNPIPLIKLHPNFIHEIINF